MLASLLRPRRRALVVASVVIVVETAASLAGPWLVRLGIDRGIPALVDGRGTGVIMLVVAAYAAAAVLSAGANRAFLVLTGRIGQDVLLELRGRLFAHLQRLSLAFHERYTSGRVVSRLTSDVDAIAELCQTGLVTLVAAALQLVGIAAVLLLLDLPLGALTLLVVPAMAVLTRWFRDRSEHAYRATRATVALVIVQFAESLAGIRAVHAFGRQARNQQIFEDLNGRYRDASLWSSRLAAVYGPGQRALGAVTTAVILAVGGMRVLDGGMTVGVLVAFLLYLRLFFDPMQELSQFYNVFQSAAAALEKLSGVLDEQPSVPEPPAPATVALDRPRGQVRFEGVRFAYRRDGGPPVLDGLDLVVPAGQTLALVGPTGAGKSTIARLLARLYDPDEGRVLLDGVDLRHLEDRALRRAVVMVTQEGFLFSGSVGDNIAFGRPGASPDEVAEAARAVGAHDLIAALPHGYDAQVGRRGARLSAGQRQLVAFARAFLADPTVLVLDEATSSLDIPSERRAQRALRTLLARRTAVIIAHRLSTVEIADRVLVVEGGRIVEDGGPATLVATGGSYATLHRAWADSLTA